MPQQDNLERFLERHPERDIFHLCHDYRYSRLKPGQIRLLVIHPSASVEDPIVCELRHVSILEARKEKYQALSYRWDDPTDLRKIYCSKCTISVTANLWDALKALRPQHVESKVWIDQICIDQKDKEEKADQIALMGKIYTDALCTVIWLGDDIWHNTAIRDKIQNFYRCVEEWRLTIPIDQLDPEVVPLRRMLFQTSHPNLDLIAELEAKEWFERVWIIQELALSRFALVMCGGAHIEWEMIAIIHKAIQGNNLHAGMPPEYPWEASKIIFLDSIKTNVSRRRRESQGTCAPLTLGSLLLGAWRFKSSLEQDKVYSLMGLAREFNEQNPSYRASYDVNMTNLLCDMFSHTLAKQDDGCIFYEQPALTTLPEVLAGGRPSWIPDVNGARKATLLGTSRMVYRASGERQLELGPFEQGNTVLMIKGRILGDIQSMVHQRRVFETDRLRTANNEIYKDIASFVHDVADYEELLLQRMHDRSWGNSASWKLDFNTFLCPALSLSNETRPISDIAEPAKFRDGITDVCSRFEKGELEVDNPLLPHWELLDVARRTQSLRFAIFKCYGRDETSRGRWGSPWNGWVPSLAREGDRVATLHGVTLPVLIRPAGPDRFLFCGVCYVQGLMYGEHEGDRMGVFGREPIAGCAPQFIRIC
jgi:hypothetical protein